MTDINVQEAINCIAERLREMADGAEAPPRVEFEVEWLNISTIERSAWSPHVSIHAVAEEVVSIADL